MPKKLINTTDSLWEIFARVTKELGEGDENARGTAPLHPTGHWHGDEKIEHYAKQAFSLESLQVMRGQNWLEQAMRNPGLGDFWVLERLIAACMEYSADDYENLRKTFFTAWVENLKADGRSKRGKDQWIRWCEVHLARHHRRAKAERLLEVLHALGLLYPGWWKQVYAFNNNTSVSALNFASPWDTNASANTAETDELTNSYGTVSQSSVTSLSDSQSSAGLARATDAQPAASNTNSHATEPEMEPPNKRQKTTDFAQGLAQMDDATTSNTNAQDDNASEASFVPEDYYPDHVWEFDRRMGRLLSFHQPASLTPAFPPAAEAWAALDDDKFAELSRPPRPVIMGVANTAGADSPSDMDESASRPQDNKNKNNNDDKRTRSPQANGGSMDERKSRQVNRDSTPTVYYYNRILHVSPPPPRPPRPYRSAYNDPSLYAVAARQRGMTEAQYARKVARSKEINRNFVDDESDPRWGDPDGVCGIVEKSDFLYPPESPIVEATGIATVTDGVKRDPHPGFGTGVRVPGMTPTVLPDILTNRDHEHPDKDKPYVPREF